MIVKCSQCQKELNLETVKYHSPIVNNVVEHVWCDAYCSVKWHKNKNDRSANGTKINQFTRKVMYKQRPEFDDSCGDIYESLMVYLMRIYVDNA